MSELAAIPAAEPLVEAPDSGLRTVGRRVLANTGIQVVSRVVGLGVSLLTIRLTTQYLGASAYGEFAVVLAFVEILSIVSDVGIPTILVRELAKTPERTVVIAATLFRLRLLVSAVVVAVSVALVPFLPYSGKVHAGLVLGIVAAVATRVGMFPTQIYQAEMRFRFLAFLDVLARLATLGLTAAVVMADLGFQALVGAQIGSGLVILAVAFTASRRMWRFSAAPDWRLARRLMVDAAPIGLLAISSLVHYKGDAILLSLMQPARDVGLYAIAFRLFDLTSFLPAFFVATIFPLLTRYVHAGDHDRAAATMKRSLNFLLLTSCPVAIGLVGFAGPLVALVAGDGFKDAARPLQILAPSLLFTFTTMLYANLLVTLNRQRALLITSVAGVVVNIALNLYCIPRWSYNGAAATTLACEAAGCLVIMTLARRAQRCPIDIAFLGRLTLACAAMGVTVVVLDGFSPWVAMPVTGATFAVCAWAVRAITAEDLRLLLPGRR